MSEQALRLYMERIDRLEEEKKGISDDIKDVYGEAKSTGFDVPTMRALRKLLRAEKHQRDEGDALIDMYRRVMGV
ncbi:DUF2312 domain-containing protein [Sphingomonas sp. S2-65]|nr:DUF2312 domain-containing protein [Sphingomonas sp. S2-65]UYY60279.1 DUF2312 domain-containing protein [Sphingomonas sp. S2-65]